MLEKSAQDHLWVKLSKKFNLSEKQVKQFKLYVKFMVASNQDINLTTITSPRKVIDDHFKDSMMLAEFVDLSTIKSIADVGAGAGFPALPLKILFPHLDVLLIEVTRKKREFLTELAHKLELENVEVCELDWRTFLRATEGDIDLFVSRAAVDDVELCRLFRTTCSYRDSEMVYWASGAYEPHKKVEKYVVKVDHYSIGQKARKLVHFKLPEESV